MPTTTSPPPTTTTTTIIPLSPQQPPLPPPQTFDLLPPLHALLSRLLPPSTSITSITTPQTTNPNQTTLTPKELGPAASAITNKIQRARIAVSELPGVEMSLEEQEGVIGELEREVRRLGGVLGGVGEGGGEGEAGRGERGGGGEGLMVNG